MLLRRANRRTIHLGCLDNDQISRESFNADDWFRSGNLGEIVDDGNVRISGRKKQIINRGGKKYFPREIEEILCGHPAFLQVAIVGKIRRSELVRILQSEGL